MSDQTEMAKRGDRDAQFNLALRYQDGTDCPRDYDQARRWYRKAASQGHTSAQYSLGLLLAKGLGSPKDARGAVEWYRTAAEGGHQAAQFILAQMYERGEGVPRDLVLAYVWFALAGSCPAAMGHRPFASNAPAAVRLLPVSRGRTVAEMHRNRLSLLLGPSERERAIGVAEEYFTKYVRPFR